MSEQAAGQVPPWLWRPSAVHRDVPAKLLPNVWPKQDAMPSGEEYVAPDAPAAAHDWETVVRPLTAESGLAGDRDMSHDGPGMRTSADRDAVTVLLAVGDMQRGPRPGEG
jgi:hypothetical protein